jgi:hypothetical protein
MQLRPQLSKILRGNDKQQSVNCQIVIFLFMAKNFYGQTQQEYLIRKNEGCKPQVHE